jgi:hypothetical protein
VRTEGFGRTNTAVDGKRYIAYDRQLALRRSAARQIAAAHLAEVDTAARPGSPKERSADVTWRLLRKPAAPAAKSLLSMFPIIVVYTKLAVCRSAPWQ